MLDWLCWEKPSKSWSNRFGLENLRLRTGKQPSLPRFLWVLISSGLNSKGSQSVQKRKLIIESLSGWWCHIAFDVHVSIFFGFLRDNDCQLTCLATCLYVTVLCISIIWVCLKIGSRLNLTHGLSSFDWEKNKMPPHGSPLTLQAWRCSTVFDYLQ